jgi:hypothetical protein
MLWFYERKGQRLSCEIRLALDSQAYELVVVWPDGKQTCERHAALPQAIRREHELHQAWKAQGWNELKG